MTTRGRAFNMAAPNSQNRTLFHGDNLEFLRGMDSETVDLVATDPPFNKSRDFHATPDSLAAGARFEDRWSWDKDVHPEWVDSIKDDWPRAHAVIESTRVAYGGDMAAFLAWLAVRLMECRRVLKPTGCLYLHIDHTAHAYVKALMDSVFGRRNFRNEIVWHYTGGGRSKSYFPRKHDTLLYYVKTPEAPFFVDAIRVPYKETSGYAKGGTVSKAGKQYMPHPDGTPVDDVWDIPIINPLAGERTGYPTQKPLALYERIIRASSSERDVVLDPFCGCATTPIAAERLGRQWVGMDIWDGALGIVKRRMEDNRQLLGDIPVIHYSTAPPVRTDAGQDAAPTLRLKVQVPEPPGPKMSHAEMKTVLIGNDGLVCKGCLRTFDDPRYLDLDHNTPRSDGGLNHVSNRLLLCGPCNRAKSNMLTLSGLRRLNKLNGPDSPPKIVGMAFVGLQQVWGVGRGVDRALRGVSERIGNG